MGDYELQQVLGARYTIAQEPPQGAKTARKKPRISKPRRPEQTPNKLGSRGATLLYTKEDVIELDGSL